MIRHLIICIFSYYSKLFHATVSQTKLCRVLNAFVHTVPGYFSCLKGEFKFFEDHTPKLTGYVQGMNLLCGSLLYVMPGLLKWFSKTSSSCTEVDAFYTFCCLIHNHLNQYFVANLVGAHQATKVMLPT